ncbi:MAG: transcription termination factor Rho [Streptomyces albidoflavus]
MTQTPDAAPAKKRSGGLSSMLIADLRSMAVGLGVSGAGSMKKAELVEAIKATQSGAGRAARTSERTDKARTAPAEAPARAEAAPAESQSRAPRAKESQAQETQAKAKQPKGDRGGADAGAAEGDAPEKQAQAPQGDRQRRGNQGGSEKGQDKSQQDKGQGSTSQDRNGQNQQGRNRNGQDRNAQGEKAQDKGPDRQANQSDHTDDADDEGGSRRNRRRRGRERTPAGRGGRNEPDTTILEDDVLVPAAGILDVLDNYAFVRTSGYLPGTDDVYLSLSIVKKYGLRRGDAVVGQVRQPREGERREKFNPMVRIDSVNGAEPDSSRERTEFDQFTPVHPDQRLRLESDAGELNGRVLDIAAPLGKGQRGLVAAEARSGKTALFASVAAALTANSPECHLMIVLVDARPEEVTDFQRSVKGEVIASTFDRPASDHTLVAELAVERAKRLVELGHDVVVLIDSLTALTRAYNQVVPSSGRGLVGGVEPAAIQATKMLMGAGRNVEDGGSLTLLAAVTTGGSETDEVILEELSGPANLEIRLSRALRERGLFPAVDVARSGTRRAEVLVGEQEAAILAGLRRSMAGQDLVAATESFLGDLAATRSNVEFLTAARGRLG